MADERLHLTLHFIGSFPDQAIGSLEERLATVPTGPMTMRAGGAELWRGGIAVLRVEPEPPLMLLQTTLAAVLSTLGVPLDSRPFAPHVTMARRAMRARPPEQTNTAAIVWEARGFALVQSITGANTAYRVLRSYQGAD